MISDMMLRNIAAYPSFASIHHSPPVNIVHNQGLSAADVMWTESTRGKDTPTSLQIEGLFIRVSHITPFFELSYTLLTTHSIGLYEVTKKNFCVIDSKLTFSERFSFLHFLEGKNAQNRPENQQNWNLAKIGPKSDKFTKSKP